MSRALKICYADVDVTATGLKDLKHVAEFAGFDFKIIEQSGPGGGNPLVRITGEFEALRGFLTSNLYDEGTEIRVCDPQPLGLPSLEDQYFDSLMDNMEPDDEFREMKSMLSAVCRRLAEYQDDWKEDKDGETLRKLELARHKVELAFAALVEL